MAKKKSTKKKKSKEPSYVSLSAPAAYTPQAYSSPYQSQLAGALDEVTNFKYDPLQDASYTALARIYGERGNIAAKDTLGDAAALNGGYGTSYGVSAAQQARNQYNQELAALVPDLEQNAFNRAQTRYSALREADESAYGRYRDAETDRYNLYRDLMSDYQANRNYNLDVANYKLSKKSSAGGGSGGGRRRSGGGGGYSGYGGNSGSGIDLSGLYGGAQSKTKTKTKTNTKSTTQNSKPKTRNIKGDFVRDESTKKIKRK